MQHYVHGCIFLVKHEKAISRIFPRKKTKQHRPPYQKMDIFDQQNPSLKSSIIKCIEEGNKIHQ